MIGLVIVSHSKPLADALIDLVRQFSANALPIARAAGVGLERREFGTDAVDIADAIQSVYSADGIVVLMDLGSAILSADMALELLPDEVRSTIHFCAAPLVEGTIAAAVQIAAGSDIETVCQEALRALCPKIEQLKPSDSTDLSDEPAETSKKPSHDQGLETELPQEAIITIRNVHGLHARPAARFVQTAAAFDADVQVAKLVSGSDSRQSIAKGPVSGISLTSLATLGVLRGDRLLIRAKGQDAKRVLEALNRLAEEHVGEASPDILSPVSSDLSPSVTPENATIPISEGIAIGPVAHYRLLRSPVPDDLIDDPEAEWQRLQQAIAATQQAIQQRRQRLNTTLGQEQAAMFDAYLLTLEDRAILDQVREQIVQQHVNATKAWHETITAIANAYAALPDTYQQQRAADILDVGSDVVASLLGETVSGILTLPEPAILIVPELTPTLVAQVDPGQVLGIVAVTGGPTSHGAILARNAGIPAIVAPALEGNTRSFMNLSAGTLVAFDGSTGEFWIEPSSQLLNDVRKRRNDWLAAQSQALEVSHQPAITRDGRRVKIAANAGSVFDAKIAVQRGAEAIGVLRTEFLYLTRQTSPSEEEQMEILSHIGENMGNAPVYVRTLDVGGDKAIPYLSLPTEANPFLGLRSIRLSLRQPDLFQTQLRAILRAGTAHDMRIMFPMISTLDEIIQARQCLEQAHQSLEDEQIPHRWPIPMAMMIETPSAALLAASFAPYVEYFSIGTNDLTQYTLAAERGNPELTGYADALHPSVLQLIRHVVEAAGQHGKQVGVCGEIAGDPAAVPVLVGLGVNELSLSPGGIPRVKTIIRQLDMLSALALAEKILPTARASEARAIAQEYLDSL